MANLEEVAKEGKEYWDEQNTPRHPFEDSYDIAQYIAEILEMGKEIKKHVGPNKGWDNIHQIKKDITNAYANDTPPEYMNKVNTILNIILD